MKKLAIRFTVTVLTLFMMIQSASAVRLLVPVGQVVGLELGEDRVTVDGFDDASESVARSAGLRIGDQLLQIEGKDIRCAEDVRKALQVSPETVRIRILREGTEKEFALKPHITKDGPRIGVFLRQGVTGIGTVTYYDPDTGKFGALGHGVNGKNEELVSLTKGFAYRAKVDAVKKGKPGDPGQLMGSVTQPEPIAVLSKNTLQGVFGTASQPFRADALPIADITEIQPGPAKIHSTIEGNTVREYSVEILKIYPHSGADGRNLLLRVTDPQLLNTTGGIIQGMSGSPIIQDGKLVGAVTHVLVNDPTTGYGIFIENMLDAAA